MNGNETSGLVIYILSVLSCVVVFAGVGIYSIKRKDPMHFWAGSKVPPEKVSDIPRYNRANGIMWIVYALVMAADIPLAFYDLFVAGMVLLAICVVGIPSLIIVYNRICKKYFM